MIFFLNRNVCLSKGHELEGLNGEGVLCIRNPWPSMARTIYGDHKRFIDTYLKPYPGYLLMRILAPNLEKLKNH